MNNPQLNILLNGKRLKVVPQRSGPSQASHFHIVIQYSTVSSSEGNQSRERDEWHPSWKGKSNFFFFFSICKRYNFIY